LALEQEPEVQGAILVVDNKTGAIKAMVGGYSFEKSEWNHAIQALRQPGSTFKPIIYSAAINNGYTPASIINDELTTFANRWTDEPYTPQNDSRDYVGPITLRRGFQQSRNVVSAKIVEYLSPPLVINYARKFGITSPMKPYMSIALGTFEVTLKEITAAYTVFPNLGYRVEPFLIKEIADLNGRIIKTGNYYNKKRVLNDESAYIMNYMMQGVVKWGTGKRARYLQELAPIGGKTGTTDDWTDAWFIGFSPSITVGVWVGYDTPRSLGEQETGSRAANPIFTAFMEKYLKKYQEPREFKKPPGIIFVKIDRLTGKVFSNECRYPFMEAFINGTEPHEPCTDEDHKNILGYYDEL
jgi:penicillin-binding protein 1A